MCVDVEWMWMRSVQEGTMRCASGGLALRHPVLPAVGRRV